MSINERIAALREQMRKKDLEAYIVIGNDPHASEYMAPHWAEMTWITGFLGESGTALITMQQALLWTDSRYYLQAEAELAGSEVQLMRESDVDCPSIPQWLVSQYAGQGKKVGLNPEMVSVNAFRSLRSELEEGEIELVSADLISGLWTTNRPAIPMNSLYIYEERYAGESVENKLARVREALRARRCQAMVIAALDEIAWLLNIRGADVDYTPCVISYVVLEMERCTLFVDGRKVPAAARERLAEQGITIADYEAVYAYLKQLNVDSVLFDGARVNEALYEAIGAQVKNKRNSSPSDLQVMMSVKNAVELAGEREAMRKDGVALTKFFRWLDQRFEQAGAQETEMSLARKLAAYRAQADTYREDSFGTIAGWQSNGAIVHYSATDEACATVQGNGLLLLDSGGQYLEGTTDITRTVWIGDEKAIPAAIKHDFTLVLKGHIALARARFPKGTRGNQLDVLARQFMWQEGISYGHGTGHGVGHFQGCHEGPANIRTDNNPNPLRKGNVLSDEPGIYRANEYGIRIENLVTVVDVPVGARSTGETYYGFEVLTLCYYDTRLIEWELLTGEEVAWLKAYHQKVYETLAPRLEEEEKKWLRERCADKG